MFQTFLTQPLYNGFIYLIGVMPEGSVGLAIIALTLLVRAVFYPLFSASIRTQMGMQAIQGDLDEINKKYKDKPDERARKTMELFRENKVRPFAGILALIIQIPIFIALYIAFFHKALPEIDSNLLYSFVSAPTHINLDFFGLFNLLTPHNIFLALVVAGLQYAVTYLSLGRIKPSANLSAEKLMAQKMQQRMMLYVLPAMIAVITYNFPAAVGLYFAVGSVISLLQEWLIRKEINKHRATLAA